MTAGGLDRQEKRIQGGLGRVLPVLARFSAVLVIWE